MFVQAPSSMSKGGAKRRKLWEFKWNAKLLSGVLEDGRAQHLLGG